MNEEVKEFQDFLAEQPKGSDVYEFVLKDIAGGKSGDNPKIATFSDDYNLGLLGVMVGLVLYRWAIDTLNARRIAQELKDAQERINLILSIEKEHGLPHDVAKELVNRTLDAIANRSNDDTAIQQILAAAENITKKQRLS